MNKLYAERKFADDLSFHCYDRWRWDLLVVQIVVLWEGETDRFWTTTLHIMKKLEKLAAGLGMSFWWSRCMTVRNNLSHAH